MPTAPQIDAPLSLGGLFPDDSSDDEKELGCKENAIADFDNCFEVQEVDLVGQKLKVRQYAFHSHNANRVWPGTFNLAEYLLERDPETGHYLRQWGSILELGTATGLLAIRLAMASSVHHPPKLECSGEKEEEKLPSESEELHYCCSTIVTSDVDDEQGDVEHNVLFNYELNGIVGENRPIHVPHTWGTGWKQSATTRGLPEDQCFETIVASDILLYVSAYGALVMTLQEIMSLSSTTKFVMSWNRRMKESSEFFDRMKVAGFHVEHEGKCVYVFTREYNTRNV
jgi:hypothetical protein